MARLVAIPTWGILRHSTWDALFVFLALGHGWVLLMKPSLVVIAVGLWWNANTISHNFIHLPFFRARPLNLIFSGYLTLLLGLPQTLWRDRHLAHHAERPWTLRLRPQLCVEALLVLMLWMILGQTAPEFFLSAYLPGFALGLGLCFLQGHFEHYAGTSSHYSRWYNLLFFNDGFHLEHHQRPSRHWRSLPAARSPAPASRFPAVLRWLEWVNLDTLERLILRSSTLQGWVVRRHEQALRRLWSDRRSPRRIVVVGGGLFPRTALILARLWPEADVTILEANAEHIACAQRLLSHRAHFECVHYDPSRRDQLPESLDLLIVPLAFRGRREDLYRQPPARHVLVHDWLWRRQGQSILISLVLLKRLNLVEA